MLIKLQMGFGVQLYKPSLSGTRMLLGHNSSKSGLGQNRPKEPCSRLVRIPPSCGRSVLIHPNDNSSLPATSGLERL
jgi:hypothetical protein